ncbi:hypothetical protein BDQ17DRAFT_1361534 [Cyathus striatus]|nr:hypothetical protein BDQ17DRAFT_1361534 [Cyathus striatus]
MSIAGLCSVYSAPLPTTILSTAREVTGRQATMLRVPVPCRPSINTPFVTTADSTSSVHLHARLKFKFVPNLLWKQKQSVFCGLEKDRGKNRFG